MSKKKATGGSTMSLKDFHGGSIPSDLPLPSAPGVTVRPPDRAGFDRPTSWGNPIGRSDHRLRPGSAGSARSTFDDKTPFLSHSSHIGRNFDEDERKPLDGVSGPRRTVSDEITRAPPTRTESKPEYSSAGRLPSGHVFSNQVSPLPGGNSSSYAARFGEGIHVEVNSQSVVGNSSHSVSFQIGGNSGLGGSGSGSASYPNAWGTWKEAVGVAEPMPLTGSGSGSGSGSNAASKLAHASALEKVSSGRWQSRQPIHHPTDVEVNRQPEMESEFHSKGGSVYSLNAYNASSLAVEDGIRGGGGRELPAHERARSPLYLETKERNPPMHPDGIRVAFNERKYGGSDLQSPVHSEPSERPKLKLLPRSKPLENLEPPVYYKLQPSDSGYVENASELFRSGNPMMTGLAGSEGGNLAVDRPKLSLKTRSQALEQLEGNTEKERKTLFGGARPREFVLKERGTDDVAVNNHEQPSIRVKQDVARIETVPIHTTSTRNNEKAENISLDHRIGKNTDRRDSRVDVEKTDVQKRNWRSENWRNTKESEKHHPQPQERPASPETWRKPVDQTPNAASPDAPGLRYGKAASAAELAQAFSRSVSDPKAAADRFPAQKSPSGQVQMPFSRLTGPTPRPRINGY